MDTVFHHVLLPIQIAVSGGSWVPILRLRKEDGLAGDVGFLSLWHGKDTTISVFYHC